MEKIYIKSQYSPHGYVEFMREENEYFCYLKYDDPDTEVIYTTTFTTHGAESEDKETISELIRGTNEIFKKYDWKPVRFGEITFTKSMSDGNLCIDIFTMDKSDVLFAEMPMVEEDKKLFDQCFDNIFKIQSSKIPENQME